MISNPSVDPDCIHELYGFYVWNEDAQVYDLWHKCPHCGLRELCNHDYHPVMERKRDTVGEKILLTD